MTLIMGNKFRLNATLALSTLLASLFVVALNVGAADKPPTAETVAERAIAGYGSRAGLYVIQRTGTLRANVKFIAPEGTREGKSVTRFIRKQKLGEDLLLVELDLPQTKYLIGFDGKETWAMQDGELQQPGPEAVKAFHNTHEHGYEALLRYKENGSKLEYVSSKTLGTLELDIIDLISPTNIRTRYEVSRKTGRIIYIDYEEKPTPEAEPVKYRLYFKDFRVIQNTLVPYETQVFQNGHLIEERKVVESAFNVQMEEKAFKAENAGKPIEAAAKQ